MDFETWLEQVGELVGIKECPGATLDRDAWKLYYDDSYSPQEAVDEDMSYL